MNLLLRILLVFFLSLLLLVGCGSESDSSGNKQMPANLESSGHEEACRVLWDYANNIEQIYLQNDWVEIEKMLPEAEAHYRSQMSKLDEAGKWTPRQNISKSLKLPFLIGRLHGALHSCKIENMRDDTSLVGCGQVRSLKDAIEKLCSE